MVNKKTFTILGLILVVFLTTGQGCSLKFKQSAPDGGIFKSTDKGENWSQKVTIPTATGQPGSIGNLDVVSMAIDPSDHEAIYVGSNDKGMYATYNGGASWWQPQDINRGRVNTIIINPKDKCTLYLGIQNQIFKSIDCSRSWASSYVDVRQDAYINSLAIDYLNPAIIYAGISSGDFVRSADSGRTWTVIKRFNSKIRKVLIDPYSNQVIYVALDGAGIWRTGDAGQNWIDVNTNLKQFSGSMNFKNLVFRYAKRDSLILSSSFGLIKTDDGGVTWQKIDLLTPPGKADIVALAVNPKNSDELIYIAGNILYKSTNGGVNWNTKKLPTNRLSTNLLFDPVDPNILYLGVMQAPK